MFDLAQALSRGVPIECTLEGHVLDMPRNFYGNRTHAMHEAFHVEVAGQRLEVLENLAIAPYVPVHPGDDVVMHGQLIPQGSHGPLMHWIHRDPSGRHEDGYLINQGRSYA